MPLYEKDPTIILIFRDYPFPHIFLVVVTFLVISSHLFSPQFCVFSISTISFRRLVIAVCTA